MIQKQRVIYLEVPDLGFEGKQNILRVKREGRCAIAATARLL
jgi:hypothetical protein